MTDEDEMLGDICPKCKKRVYFGERAPPFASKIFHKKCFQCANCNQRLDAGRYMDHQEKPYCELCYQRLFIDHEKYIKPIGNVIDGNRVILDNSDPLEGIRGKNGKLDVKRYSEMHNMNNTLKKAYDTHKKSFDQSYSNQLKPQTPKLHGYMLGNNVTMLLQGKLEDIDKEIRTRIHRLVHAQFVQFQRNLLQQVDNILDQELLRYDTTRRYVKSAEPKKDSELELIANELESIKMEDFKLDQENELKSAKTKNEIESNNTVTTRENTIISNHENNDDDNHHDDNHDDESSDDTADLLTKLAGM